MHLLISSILISSDSSITNNDNDELIAIELEITEINEQMNRLHRRRTHLIKQQKRLKETIKGNQQLATKSNDQWGRTGSYNKQEISLIIFFSF